MKEQKFCGRCQVTKNIEEFAFRSEVKGTRQSWCKECHREIDKERYYSGPRKEQVLSLNKKYKARNHKFVNRVKKKIRCSKCGYHKCAEALDFHHVEVSEDDEWVAILCNRCSSLERIKEEIRKCVVLCANCHRELHAGVD